MSTVYFLPAECFLLNFFLTENLNGFLNVELPESLVLLYVLIMPRTRFRVNPNSIVA